MGGGNTCPNCSGAIVEMGNFPEREKEIEARYCATIINELCKSKMDIWVDVALREGIAEADKMTEKEDYIIGAMIHKLAELGLKYLSLLERKGNDG
jgi:hypothetical protein